MDDENKIPPEMIIFDDVDGFEDAEPDVPTEKLAEAYREEIEKGTAEKPAPIDLKKLTDEAHDAALELQEKAAEAVKVVGQQKVDVSAMADGTIRRNGPCPCGSGRKFKKCCLDDVRAGQFRRIKAFDKKVHELPDSGYEEPRAIQKKRRAEEIKAGAKRIPHQFTKLTRPGEGFNLEALGFRKRDHLNIKQENDESAD